MHSRKLNWTELDWTELDRSVQLSSVQFSAVHWTGNDRRQPSQVLDSQEQSSQLVAGFRLVTGIALIGRFTRMCSNYEEPATTANFVAKSSRIVAARCRFNAQRKTELNGTEQFTWVQFSSVQFSAGVRLKCYGGSVKCVQRPDCSDRRRATRFNGGANSE